MNFEPFWAQKNVAFSRGFVMGSNQRTSRREAEHDHEVVTTAATILTQAAEGDPAWRMMAGIATLKAASRAAAFESDLQAVDQGEQRGSGNRSVLQTEMS
jgi:hypothetical protein